MKQSVLAFTVLVSVAFAASADAGQRTGGQPPGTFQGGARTVPASRPTRSAPPDTRVRPLPPIRTVAMSPGWPRFGRTLWPFLFYGSIGFAYFDDDVAFSQVPPDTVGPAVGGLQLDVEPRRADVYVDGLYAGPVSDFSGYYHHLDLVAGYHRLIIVTDKHEPLVVDVTVTPGRTEVFRGALSYARD